jgi:hypothetical protein
MIVPARPTVEDDVVCSLAGRVLAKSLPDASFLVGELLGNVQAHAQEQIAARPVSEWGQPLAVEAQEGVRLGACRDADGDLAG